VIDDKTQGSAATWLRCDGISNDRCRVDATVAGTATVTGTLVAVCASYLIFCL